MSDERRAAGGAEAEHGEHRLGEGDSFAEGESAKRCAGEGEIEGGGEGVEAPEAVFTAAGVEEVKRVLPVDEMFDADAAVEVDEVGAAAEENVLAVVEDFAGFGVFEGAGASAEGFAGFDEGDREAGGFEGNGGGHSRESTADDEDAVHFGLRESE